MSRLQTGLAELPRWLLLVAKKWVWLIALLPAAIDIASTYIPWFQVRIPWYWSVAIASFGLLISVYLVHLDLRARLALYEDQEPKYALQVLETSSKVCSPDQIHVDLTFRLTRKNPWSGVLLEISLGDSRLPATIGRGVISSQEYKPLDWHCYNPLKPGYAIPTAGCDFQLVLHYPVMKAPAARIQKEWLQAGIRLQLLIGYETQPLGYVQKFECLDVPINLGKIFEELVTSGIEGTQ